VGVLHVLAVARCILSVTLLRTVPSEFPLYPSDSASLYFIEKYPVQEF
jgi:hypothetical protein